MTATIGPTSPDLRALAPLGEPADAQAEPCACSAAIAAFESVQGPRRKRAASDDDVIECLDPRDPQTEPATMVQRIPV